MAERIVALATEYADEVATCIIPWSLDGQDFRANMTGAFLSFLADALSEGAPA